MGVGVPVCLCPQSLFSTTAKSWFDSFNTKLDSKRCLGEKITLNTSLTFCFRAELDVFILILCCSYLLHSKLLLRTHHIL